MDEKRNKKFNALAQEVLELARNTLVINLKFMDRAISMLDCKSVPGFGGLAVDGTSIFFDPIIVVRNFSSERSKNVRQYLHMVLHCVYHHFWVTSLVDQNYWDLACDIAVEYTINDIGLSATYTSAVADQEDAIRVLMTKVKYMTADILYRYFLDTSPDRKEISRLKKLFSADTHSIWYEPKRKEKLKMQASGQKDSAAEPDILTSDTEKKVQEWEEIARQIKIDTGIFSKKQGNSAGGLSQNLKAVTREKYNYSSFLKNFAVRSEAMKINEDEFDYVFYTYGLSLYKKMPLIEPLEYKDVKRVKDLVLAIDTSGSTSGDLVQIFVQKTYNILKQEENFFTKFNIHIIQCDTNVREDAKITNQQEFDDYLTHMKISGLGGTDFRPVFSYVNELIANHEFTNLKGLIYFTDGFGIFPSKQPDYKTAFVYVGDEFANSDVPPWAIKLVLQPEDIKRI
ncbi:MAG: VWA-like domain-containing protein [Bilifractor sp.]